MKFFNFFFTIIEHFSLSMYQNLQNIDSSQFRLFRTIVPPRSLKNVLFWSFFSFFQFVSRIAPLQIELESLNSVCKFSICPRCAFCWFRHFRVITSPSPPLTDPNMQFFAQQFFCLDFFLNHIFGRQVLINYIKKYFLKT